MHTGDLSNSECRATTTQNPHRLGEPDYPECPRHSYRVGVGLYQDYLQHVRVCVGAAASTEGEGSKDENSGRGEVSRLFFKKWSMWE